MSYLSPDQLEALRPFVSGQKVYDLGAGNLEQANKLAGLGAAEVVAVDDWLPMREMLRAKNIRLLERRFENLQENIEIGFLAAPINYPIPELLDLLKPARLIIYLGKNTDGTACAWPGFFAHVIQREVLCYVPEYTNVLAVYGALATTPRPILGEELAGLLIFGEDYFGFNQAEELANHSGILVGSNKIKLPKFPF